MCPKEHNEAETVVWLPRPGMVVPGIRPMISLVRTLNTMEWIASDSDVLNAILNAGMLLVWVVYAQLFFLSWRRGRKVKKRDGWKNGRYRGRWSRARW